MNYSLNHIPYLPGCPAYFTFDEDHAEQFHQHSGLELIWLTAGRLKVTIQRQDYDLNDNDLLLINHLEPHCVTPQVPDTHFILVHLDSLFLSNYHPDFYDLHFDVRSFRNSEDNQKAYDIIRILLSQLFNSIYHTNHQEHQEVLRLSGYLTSRFTRPAHQIDPDTPSSSQDVSIVRHILNRVERDFKGKITLNEIARETHYNSSYLSDIFRKNVGVTFKAYLEQIRIQFSLYLLQSQNTSIMNIALSSGFSDEKSYYKAIKREFDATPIQLKRRWQESSSPTDAPCMRAAHEAKIHDYASQLIESCMLEKNTLQVSIVKDIQSEGYKLKPVWSKMMNIGSANTLLNQNMRDQIKEMTEDIPIEYIRFEGIFNQEMDIIQKDQGGLKFNWKFVNHILDYLQDIEVKPFICLSYMPLAFASKSTSFFNYQGNTSPPKKMSQWLALVQSFITNCINRYGLDNVSTWYVQIWTEFPVYDIHWSGTLEQYFELYRQTALLIKGISPTIKVGPAAENFHTNDQPSERLLEFCQDHAVPIDFYSCNIYHNRINFIEWRERSSADKVDIQSIPFQYESKNHTKHVLVRTHRMLRTHYAEDVEFIVTRWNLSWDVTNSLHDTAFMSTFIVDNMLDESAANAGSIGFLSASDILYEWDIKNAPFYGGTGLVNTEGIKKSAYYAFVFLSKLGGLVIAKGKNHIITRQGDNLQILVYNHTYLNQLYVRGQQQEQQIYHNFEESSDLSVDIHLQNIYGTYKCKQYSLNQAHGSAYDEWVRMGEYVDLNDEETEYLKNISRPVLRIRQVVLKGEFQFSLHVPVHGIECVTLNKLYN